MTANMDTLTVNTLTKYLTTKQINHIIRYWQTSRKAMNDFRFTFNLDVELTEEDDETNRDIYERCYERQSNDAHLRQEIYIKFLIEEYRQYILSIGLSLNDEEQDEDLFNFINNGMYTK